MPSSLNFILQTNPKHLAENVPLDQMIVVDLMVDLNRNEFKENHVMLYNVTERKNVPTRAEYRSRTIYIYPLTKLEPNMHYEVTLLGGEGRGLKTITGRYLEESYVFEFYTKDTDGIKPPTITSPTHLTEVYDDVTFQWATVPNAFYYELQISQSPNFDLLVWPTEQDVHVYEGHATPDINYTSGTYYARIRSVDRDKMKSAWSKPIQFYFDAEQKVDTEENNQNTPAERKEGQKESNRKVILEAKSVRSTQPTQLTVLQQLLMDTSLEGSNQLYVNKTMPKHQALNLPLAQIKEIIIEFSDTLDPDSITKDTVYLIAERN